MIPHPDDDSTRFEPTDTQQVKDMLAHARRVNLRRDRDERAVGFAAPPDIGVKEYLRTAISALIAGLETKDWRCIAEGTAMCQEIERCVRIVEIGSRS